MRLRNAAGLGAGKYYSHFFTTLFFRFVWVFSGAHTHKIGQLCPLFDIFRRNSLLNFLIGYWFTLFLASFHKFNCIYNKIKRFKILLVSAFYSRAECEVSRKVYHTLPPPFILNKCSRQLFYRLRQLKSSRRSGASNLYPDWNFRIKVSIEFCRT